MIRSQRAERRLAFAIGAALMLSHPVAAQERAAGYAPITPLDDAVELKMKIAQPFTIAVGGDLNYHYPINQSADPAVQGILSIFRNADAAVANLEGSVTDFHDPVGTLNGDARDKSILQDVRDMGFDIVSRANNHAVEGGLDQMLDESKLLDEVGLKHAGVGRDLAEARAAQYANLPKGRIGMVSMTTNLFAGSKASLRFGIYGGDAGQNILDLTKYQIVTQQQMDALRQIRDSVYEHRAEFSAPVPPLPANEPKDRLQLLQGGERFKVGDRPGGLSYEMNPADLRDILRNVRNGKETADYMVTTIHTHEDSNALWLQFWDNTPTDFEVELAHKSIDAGSDMFFATGIHILRGIEIYKNRPIFYGMSHVTYSLQQAIASLQYYTGRGLNPYTTTETDLEQSWAFYDQPDRPRLSGEMLDSFVAEAKYDKGELREVIVHPITVDGNKSEMGTPRVPIPQEAQRILHRIQKLSASLGTKISIENNLGIIRVSAAK